MPKLNIIVPNDRSLSLEAVGVLATMINACEDDYCTDEELHMSLEADTLETIRSALKELVVKEYVIQLDGNIYAVNKLKIPHMKLI